MYTRVIDIGLLQLVPMKDVVSNMLRDQFPMSTAGFHHSGSHHSGLSPAHPPYRCLQIGVLMYRIRVNMIYIKNKVVLFFSNLSFNVLNYILYHQY
jgi:hypothetical protein